MGVEELNETNIILIMKTISPKYVNQYRPISFCNLCDKVISKILTNRMKGSLPKFIFENQRAFVLGRLIQDNILISHVAFHYLKSKKKGESYELALKVV